MTNSPFTIEPDCRVQGLDKPLWLWRLWTPNGLLLAEAPRTYASASDARRALTAMLKRIEAPAWMAVAAKIER